MNKYLRVYCVPLFTAGFGAIVGGRSGKGLSSVINYE